MPTFRETSFCSKQGFFFLSPFFLIKNQFPAIMHESFTFFLFISRMCINKDKTIHDELNVCTHVCDSGVSMCSGVLSVVVPCDLNVLASYTHTVSIPSPAVCSGTQVGKGKRQATTLAVLGNSLASFSSSCSI